jgi:hypothetical protein
MAVTVALLIAGVVGVSVVTQTGSDADTGYGTGTGTGTDDPDTTYGTGTDDWPDDAGTTPVPSVPSVPDDTASPPTSGTAGAYVVVPYAGAWAGGVESTLDAYFGGINSGDPQTAWMQLSPSWQQRSSLDEFADAVRTTHDSDFVVQDASYTGGRADVWLEFTSTQDPELGPDPGEACTRWSLDYVLLEQPDGTFLIDDVAGHGGTTGHSPC